LALVTEFTLCRSG